MGGKKISYLRAFSSLLLKHTTEGRAWVPAVKRWVWHIGSNVPACGLLFSVTLGQRLWAWCFQSVSSWWSPKSSLSSVIIFCYVICNLLFSVSPFSNHFQPLFLLKGQVLPPSVFLEAHLISFGIIHFLSVYSATGHPLWGAADRF